MENKPISLRTYAMHYGTLMGIFWIIKFIFFPLGLENNTFLFIFAGFTLVVPFLGYFYAKTVRDRVFGGEFSFFQSWSFLLLTYMFAALLTTVAHYIYFRFMDQGLFIASLTESQNMVEQEINRIHELSPNSLTGIENYLAQAREKIKMLDAMTPIQIVMQFFSQNIFYCSIVALITALFVARRKPVLPPTPLA